MNLQNRVSKLEAAEVRRKIDEFDLTLLTDAELLALDACYRKAEETGKPILECITPEVDAAMERVFNTPRA